MEKELKKEKEKTEEKEEKEKTEERHDRGALCAPLV